MSNTDSKKLNFDLNKLLYQIYSSDEVYEDSYLNKDTYLFMVNKLVDTLSSDINIAISFFESLDLNDRVDAYIIHFVNKIIEKFKSQEDKENFMELLDTLSEKYSNSEYINWSLFKFYTFTNCLSKLLSSSENNSNSEKDIEN